MYPLGPEAEETPLEWVNYNVLLAQLEAAGVWLARMPSYAIWEMRDAFVTDLGANSQDRELHQCHIKAAAQWILWDGQEIFKYMANPLPVSEGDTRLWQIGDRYTMLAVPEVSLARWRLCKEGFGAAGAEGGDGSQECRDLARRAAALMDAIENNEKSMSFWRMHRIAILYALLLSCSRMRLWRLLNSHPITYHNSGTRP